jgi:hypothetical protein
MMNRGKATNMLMEFIKQPLPVFNRGIGWGKSRLLKKEHLCLACFPKSGSTYLAKTLEEVLDFKFVHYAHLLDDEHCIVEPLLIQNLHSNTVTHLHITGSASSLFYLDYYKIKSVVQVRNIFDCVVSLREHILEESPVWPMAVVEQDFFAWSSEKQYDFIIDNFIPWYIKFYVSWFRVSQKGQLPLFWLQYEDLMENKYKVICNLLEYFKINFDKKRLERVLDEQSMKLKKGDHRLNVGIQGRGLKKLNLAQVSRIKSFARYYPSVDFGKVGL